jgi:hypothetical protein
MKKFLFLFLLLVFSFNIFACLIDDDGVHTLFVTKIIYRFPNFSSQQQQQVVANISNNAATLSTNTSLSNQAINSITTGLANNAP